MAENGLHDHKSARGLTAFLVIAFWADCFSEIVFLCGGFFDGLKKGCGLRLVAFDMLRVPPKRYKKRKEDDF